VSGDLVGAMERDGFVVLHGTFPVELVDAVAAAYGRMLDERRDPGMVVGPGRVQLPVVLRPPFTDEALVCKLLPLLGMLLGDDLLIASYGSVVAWPGAGVQHLHRDHGPLFPMPLGGELPCHAVTLVVPLVDLDASTGTTALFPGTHRVGSPEGVEPEMAWARRGDCFLMDYRIFHAGTPNVGAWPRPLLYIVYSRPWFVDALNYHEMPPLIVGPEGLAGVGPKARWVLRRC